MAILAFYLGLGTLLMLEEAGLFFLPGDVSLVAAGIHDAGHRSQLVLSWTVASIGMVAGASVLYHSVRRVPSTNRLIPQRVQLLIHRHGVLGVAVARLVPGLRNATVFAAASAQLPYRTFLMGVAPAAATWAALLLLAGWFGGDAILSLLQRVHGGHLAQLASLFLLGGAAAFVIYRLRRQRDEHQPPISPAPDHPPPS
jgi:membrane protein DedA with SNARE-associated domain